MKKLLNMLKAKKWLTWTVSGLVIVTIGIIALSRGGDNDHEGFVVVRRDLTDEVRVAGTVEATIVSDLGFEGSGVVRTVNVDVNDTVAKGQTLASLSLGTLSAELASAQAAVAIKQAQTANTSINLDAIRDKQDTLVKNAQIALFSEGLIAEPKSPTYTQTPPIISGRYAGQEGTYKFTVRSAAQSDQRDLYVFDAESPEPVRVSKTGATPLGTRGLFVIFPDGAASYEDTTWYVTIPNTKSSVYAQNYSTYQAAIRERDQSLEAAQNDIRQQSEGSSIAVGELAQARAEVERIQALIGQRILRAPFSGTVTAVAIDPGETVTSGTPAISLISNDGFGVEVDLPEIDSIKVHTGDTAMITLDAFGDDPLPGTVVSVNRTETTVDGISVYEARIAFDAPDDRIASGMTADVAIVTGAVHDVLAVPARALHYHDNGTPYVIVRDAATNDDHEAEVALGLRGSDGFVEITAGLSESDSIVVPTVTK